MAGEFELKIEGIADLRAQLLRLPDDLKAEARGVVLEHARSAAAEIKAAYPRVTGALKRGMRIEEYDSGKYGVMVRVRNVAPHAWLYENGSALRHYGTLSRGRMPKAPAKIFVPIAMRWRRSLNRALVAIVRRTGLVVRGEAA